MSNQNKFKIVYKMEYAMALIEQGHEVFQTAANPNNPNLLMWIFKVDDTFEQDLLQLIREGRRIER